VIDDDERHRGKISLHEISIYEKAMDAATIAKRGGYLLNFDLRELLCVEI
jgi:hypothetical protein